MNKLRVLVCGGRNFQDQALVIRTLDAIATEFDLYAPPDKYGNTLPLGMIIIAGGATGADSHARDYAVVNWLQFEEFPAQWHKYGSAAGPIRNSRMLDEGKPELVIAFPGGKGTAHMVGLAKAKGVPVREIKGGPQ